MRVTRRLLDGPLKDGIEINARELAAATNMSTNAMCKALEELERKGFIANLTPWLPIDKAVVRLTMFEFQGQPATEDYVNYKPTPAEQRRLDWLDRQDAREAKRFSKLNRAPA
jgi:hypothetical protein